MKGHLVLNLVELSRNNRMRGIYQLTAGFIQKCRRLLRHNGFICKKGSIGKLLGELSAKITGADTGEAETPFHTNNYLPIGKNKMLFKQ